ncbi:Uncharacterized protein TCM_014672 [Theobroma cacao]|uniref:Uncharacterized protein n=1 Tax=Theobroma cacao TaxID=3641 RepID=A0A061FZ37_THECC|nr:Uncharacterized protein TCM_014672 [Theobroma cacao]
MVERSLSMREVRGSIPRISKDTFNLMRKSRGLFPVNERVSRKSQGNGTPLFLGEPLPVLPVPGALASPSASELASRLIWMKERSKILLALSMELEMSFMPPRIFFVVLGPEYYVRRVTLNFQYMGGCPWRVKKDLNSPLNGLKFSKVGVLYSNGMREDTLDDAGPGLPWAAPSVLSLREP